MPPMIRFMAARKGDSFMAITATIVTCPSMLSSAKCRFGPSCAPATAMPARVPCVPCRPSSPRFAGAAPRPGFGRIDVLVNNAASFYAGYFEELTPEQMERQLSTSLTGPMNVTRAVLPVMRKQRSGQIISISSSAGLTGFAFGTAYAASKFGLEGWMQSLQAEVEPFGIDTIIVNPGFFRTELLTPESTNYAECRVDDYNDARAQQMEFWKGQNGRQSG